MAKRIEPENVVVDFFSNEQPEKVRTVFLIVKGIVDRRGLLQKRKKATRGAGKDKDASQATQG